MNTGILITARLKSTRLPRKVLRPLLGRPMLQWLVERLRLSRNAPPLVIMTSPLAEDRPLVDLAAEWGVQSFEGDPDDVLARMRDAAAAFDLDHVISCTADNPLVDPQWADRLMEHHLHTGADYSRIDGLPFGTFCYALSREALEGACEMKATSDTEVWGGYFTETGAFRTSVLDVDDPAVRRPELRLTVDTPEDFEVVGRVFEALGERIFPLEEVVSYLDEHPEVARLNEGVRQAPARPIRLRSGSE